MPREHIGEKTNCQHEALEHQAKKFDRPQHDPDRELHRQRHVHVRREGQHVSLEAETHDAGGTDRDVRSHRQHGCGRKARSGRAHEREHAEQIAGQDEQEDRPEVGHIAVGFFADVGLGNVIANKGEDRLEEVPPGAARGVAGLDLLRQGQIDGKDDSRGNQHEDGILGESESLSAECRMRADHWDFPMQAFKEVPLHRIQHMAEGVREKHPVPHACGDPSSLGCCRTRIVISNAKSTK